MNKPTKPNIVIPESFAENGIKTDFDNEKLTNGFDRVQPDVLAGDNLNKFIDDTYKGLNYGIAAADAINLINEGETLTVQNGQLVSGSTGSGLELCDTDIVMRNDKKIFEQLKQMKRSTFDKFKFTVVGSPTITDDGLASGFSGTYSTEYIKSYKTINTTNADNMRIEYSFTIMKAFTKGQTFLLNYGNSAINGSPNIQLYGPLSAIQGSINSNASKYTSWEVGDNFKVVYDLQTNKPSTYTLFKNDVKVIETSGSYTDWKQNAPLYLYGNYSGDGAVSVDLSQCSITVDGKEVFNGNKTGLDVIKPDNYEVVGSPTISDDGIASGFNITDYLSIDDYIVNKDRFKIEMEIKTPDGSQATGSGFTGVIASKNVRGFEIVYNDIKKNLQLLLSSDGSSWDIASNTVIANVPLNSRVKLIVEKTDTQYIFQATNLEINTIIGTIIINSTQKITATQNEIYIGIARDKIAKENFKGSINLNSFKIYIDGNLVYQPTLRIPYTQSKTGSKIVDGVYRDRVQDVYEQFGTAPYYTLDETNQNFTLPMGEIYGMIESKATYQPPLLSAMWSDHLLNDMSWLRADTFSWQSGTTYSLVYNELLSEYNNSASTTKKDGSITYKRTPKGYKIALSNQESAILSKYNSYGTAWYYILDTANKRFKLPRTKFGFEGLRTSVGDDIKPKLPNIKGGFNGNELWDSDFYTTGCFTKNSGVSRQTGGGGDSSQTGIGFDASLSSSIYQNDCNTVQPPATQMYLYFYVGGFTKSAEAQTAGLNAELLNGKADVSTPSIQAPYLKTTYINGTSGYRIWSDGYCEQWGFLNGAIVTVTLLKKYKDTNYEIYCQWWGGKSNNFFASDQFINNITSGGFETNGKSQENVKQRSWRTCGYLAEGEY